MSQNLLVCPEEAIFFDSQVKYKWLRPIKIGNRNETVWAYEGKPYSEFMDLLGSFYEDKYRMHNWVYKHQDSQRRNCRKRLQLGEIILEFDYAAKASQFVQDCLPCSATNQTSNFVVFVHFDPKSDDLGNNISDTTEVFTFHSNCLKQDSQSIRRCLTHVIQNMRSRHLLKTLAHLWADGSGTQNKG